MARPSKLDDDLAKRILAYVRAGNTYEIASEATGVSRSTFYSWQSRGKRAIKAIRKENRIDNIERPYIDFFKALEMAKAIATAVVRVRDAMSDDWRAAIAFLERRDPKNWGKHRSRAVIPLGQMLPTKIDPEELTIIKNSVHRTFPSLGEPRF